MALISTITSEEFKKGIYPPRLAQARKRAWELKYLIRSGSIPYDEGVRELAGVLKILDEGAKVIAKKYGKRHAPFNVIQFLR